MNPNDQSFRASLSGHGGARFLIRWRGRQEGPFELDMIKAKLQAKQIGLLHEVSRDGQWITLREFLDEQKQVQQRETRALLRQEKQQEEKRVRQEEKRVRQEENQRVEQEKQLREVEYAKQREWEHQESQTREDREDREDRQQQAQNNRRDDWQEVLFWFLFSMFWLWFLHYRNSR